MNAITDQEARTLQRISEMVDPEGLEQIAANASGRSPVVELAALRRLAAVSPKHAGGTIEHACWAMVHAVEALRRLSGRKAWRMNRLRPKIQAEGEIAALEYCASYETEGFAEVLAYGAPELTAEAIALAHPQHFSDAALEAARARLLEAGVQLDDAGRVVARV
ncbi:hypothetical protein [Phenylobacterium zucineum]|uniref:hypothetical protein n=1 Tax=Phenylobacterium zucineum TaxID=284016 RepID=UPI00059D0DE5|nr:hypothetical protein [Phenylobacterium zucineum]